MTLPARIKPALAGTLLVCAIAAAPAHAALPQLSGAVDLMSAKPNATIDGAARTDLAGGAVARAGDVNGDGLADVVVGAVQADPRGRRDAGGAYVVFGRADGASVDLAKLGVGGLRIDGAAAGDHMGAAAAPAGDVNGDGLADVVVGARDADPRGRGNAGAAYVIFGRRSGGTLDGSTLAAADGYRIDGAAAGDRLGSAVAGGLDVNGDGTPDVVVAAPQADRNARTSSGTAYVVYGRSSGDAVDTRTLDGMGYAIDGAAANDQLGTVALTNDLTGDGRADVLLGARFANAGAGAAYVVGGGAGADLAAPGAAWFVATGGAAGDGFGAAVAQGGDLDGDGRGDLLVGAPGTDFNARPDSGSAYVLRDAAAGGVQDLDGVWRLDGAVAGGAAGSAVDASGDLDSDGRADLAIGSPLADRPGRVDSGATHVLYGGRFGGVVDLAGVSGAIGFSADGATGDAAGASVAFIGDANGDGRGDLLTGVPLSDHLGRSNSGSAYYLWGFGTPHLSYPGVLSGVVSEPVTPVGPGAIVRTGVPFFTISPALPTGLALDPWTGVISGSPVEIQEQPVTYTLTMTDFAGSVSAPVTLRVAPLPGACANVRGGTPQADQISGTSGGDRIESGAGSDQVDGLAGDDCVNGGDAADALNGGAGNDALAGGNDRDKLAGGDGADVLAGENDADTLDGGAGDDRLDGGDESDALDGGPGADWLAGGVSPDRLFGGDGGDELHGGSEQDQISGGDGDDQLFGDEEQDILAGGGGQDTIRGGSGFDEISGGDGGDRLFGDDDSDVIDGGAGSDRVAGGSSTDKLSGGPGRDVLLGGGGNDIIGDGSGGTRVDAGAGSDWVRVRNGRRDRVVCGRGTDHVSADRGDRLHGCEKVSRGR